MKDKILKRKLKENGFDEFVNKGSGFFETITEAMQEYSEKELKLMLSNRLIGVSDIKDVPIRENDLLKVGEFLECKVVWISKNLDDYGDEIHCAYHLEILNGNEKGKLIPIDGYALSNCVVIKN